MNAPTTTKPGWWRPATRGGRVWLGIATLWPLLYIFLVAGTMVTMFLAGVVAANGKPGQPPEWVHGLMAGFMAIHCLTMVAGLALIVVYVVSVVNNPRLDQTMRIIWILLTLFGGAFAMPVYWYLYLWRNREEVSETARSAPTPPG